MKKGSGKKLTRKEKQNLNRQSDHGKQGKEPSNYLKIYGWIAAGFAFLLYVNTIGHGYVLDDYSVIKDNWLVQRGLEGIPQILETSYRFGYWNSPGSLYRPLSLVMFAVEWELFPEQPQFSHFINILLYSLTGLLLFLTLASIFRKQGVLLSFIATLLFIAHPVHTEVVANIKSRDEILSFLFVLLSVFCLFKYLDTRKVKLLIFSLSAYFLAFLSKESAITMLAVFPLLIYLFKTDIPTRQNIKLSALLTLPALLYLAIRASVLGDVKGVDNVDVLDNLLTAAPDTASQLATAVFILGKYLLLLVFPHPLVSDYSFNQIAITTWGDPLVIASLLIHAGMGAFALYNIRKKPVIAFGILFYFITISLYSNLVITIGSSLGERFLYVPSLGFCLVLAVVLSKLFSKKGETPENFRLSSVFSANKPLFLASGLLLLAYSGKTIARNMDWKSQFRLYSEDVKNCPNSARLHYNLALEWMQRKALKTSDQQKKMQYLDSSIASFTRAIQIYPSYADAYDQCGLAFYRKGNLQKAEEYYLLALKYNPQKSVTYSNLGAIYFNAGNYQEALNIYQKAVKYNPRYADAYLNMGSTLATIGKYREAIDAYKNGLQYAPNNAHLNYFLGVTYQNTGDNKNADYYLNRAYQLNPKLRK